MKLNLLVFVAVIVFSSLFALGQGSGPDATVRTFYTYSNTHSSTFNRRHVDSRKQWYTPALLDAFNAQLEEDTAHLKLNPTDKPYFGDGLTFRPLDEPCEVNGRSYKRIQRITRTEIVNSRATVSVSFAYPKACTMGGEPIVYRVKLIRISGRWLIDDWEYEEGPSLVADMKAKNY